MLKHIQSEHRNIKSNECDFKWQVISKFRKPMQRQISEAINIENSNASELLNLKNEYFRGIDLYKEQIICKYCSLELESLEEIKSHIEYVHQRYECQKCDYKAYGSRDLRTHTQNTHDQKN